jgi:hypothetical protein
MLMSYNLSDTESLLFRTNRDCFEVFSLHEGAADKTKIATYKGGKWIFDDFNQQRLFWLLYDRYKIQFGKAFKAYNRSLQEKPQTYIVTCAKRRFDIKITKMKRNMWDWFYGTFYGK